MQKQKKCLVNIADFLCDISIDIIRMNAVQKICLESGQYHHSMLIHNREYLTEMCLICWEIIRLVETYLPVPDVSLKGKSHNILSSWRFLNGWKSTRHLVVNYLLLYSIYKYIKACYLPCLYWKKIFLMVPVINTIRPKVIMHLFFMLRENILIWLSMYTFNTAVVHMTNI